MPNCELCGRERESLIRAEIEGSVLVVCEDCGRFGKALGRVRSEEEIKKILVPKQKRVEEEIEERVISDFGERLRRAREKREMNQEDFAKILNEKESLVHKWEGGSLKPGLEVARKLEKLLRMNLIEIVEGGVKGVGGEGAGGKKGEVTLGDVIKVRKKKGQE